MRTTPFVIPRGIFPLIGLLDRAGEDARGMTIPPEVTGESVWNLGKILYTEMGPDVIVSEGPLHGIETQLSITTLSCSLHPHLLSFCKNLFQHDIRGNA
ncbi:MAG: hypothetical protein ONB42_11780 [candidate division KSB1 bacterium]|nr:hypothetical protein [candidate division KSB1 bacterium]